jgi:cytoplasmic iron level regulating protein YaaA (DUF328/UPF0246 family)
MLIVLSPAKTLDYDTPLSLTQSTEPDFIAEAAELIGHLRQLSPAQLGSQMQISDALAALNFDRYARWRPKATSKNARQAILAFNGDVYEGLAAATLTARQLTFAQSHVRILSGLYGVLRPFDLMQPYRLEMGTKLATRSGKDLYAFWGERITDALNAALAYQKKKVLINLASEEYFKSVKPRLLHAPVVTPVFEDWKSGKYKVISFHAKRARGLMARFAITQKLTEPERLKDFAAEGYAFDANASERDRWIFRRRLGD